MEMEKRRTRRRREEKRRSTTEDLSDDVMVKILGLLPLNSIVQCRNVCKRWQSLTNYFLTNPFNVAASLHCYPHNYKCMERAQRGGILQISDLDLCIDFPKDGPYHRRILSSCNGLFFSSYLHGGIETPFLVECYISNPWTKEYVPLPKPRGLRSILSSYYSLCGLVVENHSRDNNNNNNVALYKIVMAHMCKAPPKDEHRYHYAYKFEIYSPDVKRWLTLRRGPERHRCRGTLDQTAVYCNRVLYWQCHMKWRGQKQHALMFNVETETPGYLYLPSANNDDESILEWRESVHGLGCKLTECDGQLLYFRTDPGPGRLIIWKMLTSSRWSVLHNVDLKGAMKSNPGLFPLHGQGISLTSIPPIGMSLKGDDKVLLKHDNSRVVSYDLKKGVFELLLQKEPQDRRSLWNFFRYIPTTKFI